MASQNDFRSMTSAANLLHSGFARTVRQLGRVRFGNSQITCQKDGAADENALSYWQTGHSFIMQNSPAKLPAQRLNRDVK